MKTYEVLERALALIEDEKNWTQKDYRVGDALCAEGACVLGGGGTIDAHNVAMWTGKADAAVRALGSALSGPVHVFNDSHSHAEVVALFQKAIANEKRKAGVYIELPVEEPVAS